jgi:hypothetical protein
MMTGIIPKVATISGGAKGMEPSGVKHTIASIANKIENWTKSKVFWRDEFLSDIISTFSFCLNGDN